MFLVVVTALIAICGADKLDRTYLPPASAHTAGGSPGSLQTPFRSFNQGLGGLPTGGYRNEFDGVVVDAAAAGTRASGPDATGLGGPRVTYGSTDSKVGEAAFTADTAFPRVGIHSGLTKETGSSAASRVSSPERLQASRDRASNTVKYENDVSHDSFNYAFETDNGIVAEENGVEVNGVRAQGGYSYTGDDGQVYSVTYTADEGGYQPRGDHLPTPPPIPQEILKSLEQNAKDEASGVVDDGSYDAQKYNTGEDYTKSDNANEKYNKQPSVFGSKPQTDADSSSSFVNQNNQGFARPNFGQFGSVPSQSSSSVVSGFDSSKNKFSGNHFGISSADKDSQTGQTFGFGSGSNNEYLPPANGFNLNRRPTFNNYNQPQVTRSQQQSTFTQNTGPSSSVTTDPKKDQNSEPSFVPLSQQKLQEDNPKKPQGRPSIFGKPTIIDSSLSIKDPFGNRPSNNRFTQNKSPAQKPQNNRPIGGSFEVVSGNVYSSKNEYLPPRRQFNAPNQSNQGFQTSSSRIPPSGPLTDFKSQFYGVGSNTPSVTAFASVSRPTLGFESQRYNGQQQYRGQQTQNTGNGLSSLIANSRLPLNKDQSKHTSGISSATSFTSSSLSQSPYKPSIGSQSPTLQPQTELTTPLESNTDQKNSAPVPIIDGPDSPNIGGASLNLPSFGLPLSSNYFGQSGLNTNKYQQAFPTQASATAFSSIRGPANTPGLQNIPSSGLVEGNIGGQFSNKQPFDVQYSSSTHRPSFSQNTQQQGSDDSYHYNTPSRHFNIPTARPELSSPGFLSSPFNKPFGVTQPPLGAKPQTSDFSQTSFASESNKPIGSTRYPRPPTLEPVSPTFPSIPFKEVSNNFQSPFNKVTQASASVFSSPVPTAPSNIHKFGTSASQPSDTHFNQEGPGSSPFIAQAIATILPGRDQEGNQRISGAGKPGSSTGLSFQSQQSNQYNGEIYEYNKPPQTLPAPQHTVSSAQNGQNSQFGASAIQNSGSYKPNSQFGPTFTQQTLSGQPQNSQMSQEFNLIGQVQAQSQPDSRPGQFGSQISTQTQDSQGSKGNQAFNYNGQGQIQSQSESRPTPFPLKPVQNFQTSQGNGNQAFNFNTQKQTQSQSEQRPGQFGSVSEQSQNLRPVQGASKFPPVYDKEGPSCCKQAQFGSQSSQDNQQNGALSGSQIGTNQGSDLAEPASQGTKPVDSVSSFAGVAESFGGPRKPPSFDASGYHY